MKKEIFTKDAPAPIGPYSQAVLVANTLYISGQIPINPKNNLLENESIETETHQVLKNLEAILKAAEMGFADIVKCSIFITDMNDFPKINEVYSSYFKNCIAPTRETVAVKALPKKCRIEISAIAFKN